MEQHYFVFLSLRFHFNFKRPRDLVLSLFIFQMRFIPLCISSKINTLFANYFIYMSVRPLGQISLWSLCLYAHRPFPCQSKPLHLPALVLPSGQAPLSYRIFTNLCLFQPPCKFVTVKFGRNKLGQHSDSESLPNLNIKKKNMSVYFFLFFYSFCAVPFQF
jgi:hypothetical protein